MIFSEIIPKDISRIILPFEFFQDEDVPALAKRLLGKVLVSHIGGTEAAGIVVETEAYRGMDDRACHAYLNRRTKRTETMFMPGGHAYVYLCYGIHHLFNVVSGPAEVPNAVLIRAIEPVMGIDEMLRRRKIPSFSPGLSSGPGCLTKALGIRTEIDRQALWEKPGIWLEDWSLPLEDSGIAATTRVGVGYAKEDALRPWRFFVKKNPFVSAVPKGLESER